jgi:hypothetical protein
MPIHPSFQGIDLFNTNVAPKRSIYMVVQTPDAYQYGIVRSDFKLIYDERQREHLLFNLARDPEEKINIAFVQPAVVRDLASRLNRGVSCKSITMQILLCKHANTRRFLKINSQPFACQTCANDENMYIKSAVNA